MSALKDLAKGGWHPGGDKKPSSPSSSSTSSGRFSNIKGADRVAGLLGRGGPKASTSEAYENHRSTPLSALQDPDSFGPPPKRHGNGGIPSSQGGPEASATSGKPAAPARPKPGTQVVEEEEQPPRASGPFRPDTTGLSTANLPAPPVRRAGAVAQEAATVPMARNTGPKAAPKLPPRLPPRQAAVPSDPPPAYSSPSPLPARPTPPPGAGLLNTAAAGRLANAGVSVPAFGIGGSYRAPVAAGLNSPNPSANPVTATTTAGTGTTWAEKRAALETAQKFKQDPSSVSFQDMKSSASTAKNFHDRHGEQVASGMRFANKFNNKYSEGQTLGSSATSSTASGTGTGLSSSLASLSLKKAAPPPPPAKRRDPGDGAGPPPPPVPLGSKPTLS